MRSRRPRAVACPLDTRASSSHAEGWLGRLPQGLETRPWSARRPGPFRFRKNKMSTQKLLGLPNHNERRAATAAGLQISLEQSAGYLGDAIVRARAMQDCQVDLRTLPVYRT